jgi:hypothetical protein
MVMFFGSFERSRHFHGMLKAAMVERIKKQGVGAVKMKEEG